MSLLSVGEEIIKLGAPLVGFLLPGPFGAVVTAAVEKLFGATPGDTQDLLEKIQTDNNAVQKLQALQLENQLHYQQLIAQQQEQLYKYDQAFVDNDVKDAEAARAMEEETHSIMPHIVTMILSVALTCSLFALFYFTIPQGNKEIIVGLIALLGWLFMLACRFWLGGAIPTIHDIEALKDKKL